MHMATGAREQYSKRIRLEEDALAGARVRVAELRLAENETRATLAAAQAKLDAIASELKELTSREQSLGRSLDSTRRLYRRTLWMDVIPLDVLSSIFEASATFIDPHEPLVDAIATISTGTAFGLATVCSRWRQLALSSRRIWTLVKVRRRSGRPYDAELKDHIQRIRIILERSVSVPIDVVVHIDDFPHEALPLLRKLFARLEPQAFRWRRAELWLPAWFPLEPSLDFLKGSMPSLTQLRVVIDGDADWEPNTCPQYFSHMPLLRHLELQSTGMSCVRPGFVFNALRSLTFWSKIGMDQFLDLVRAAASTLERLHIAASTDGDFTTVTESITLPVLHTLEIDANIFGLHNAFQAPNVQHLALDGKFITGRYTPLYDALSGSITALTLSASNLDGMELAILRNLSKITSISFICQEEERSFSFGSGLFEALAGSSPPTWPALRSIRFGKGDISSSVGNGLVTLLRARNRDATTASSGTASPLPSKIQSVELPRTAPLWLRENIETLLGSAAVRTAPNYITIEANCPKKTSS